MQKQTIKPPKMPKNSEDLRDTLPDENTLQNNAQYEGFFLTAHDYSKQIASHVSMSQMHFERASLGLTQCPSIDGSDLIFAGCDLANAAWRKATIYRAEISGSRLTGFKANEAHLKDVVFSDSNVSLAQFRFAHFKAVRFENCILRGADFTESDLRGVIFKDCDLREAEFSFAKLENTNFCGSKLDGLRVRPEDLRGAIVEPFQAAYFAGLLGLNVRWSDTGAED
jgi:uncharacterized protein YjbI with pentapeptide repeats